MKGIIKSALVLGGMYGAYRLGVYLGSMAGYGLGLKDCVENDTVRAIKTPEHWEIRSLKDFKKLWAYEVLKTRDRELKAFYIDDFLSLKEDEEK